MESSSPSSFARILRESLVIFLKNRFLMLSIALLILLLHSILFLCNYYFSIEPFTKDSVMKRAYKLFFAAPRSSQHMTSEFLHLAVLAWFFFLVHSMASLFSSAITILASSAVNYAEANLSFKGLLPRVFRSFKRPTITWFYISLFNLGYFALVFSLIFPFTLNFSYPITFVYVMMISSSAFHTYLVVVWRMSVVISVLEEKRGLEALEKAWKILEGFKLQGFLLNLVYEVPVLIGYIWWYMKSQKKGINYSLVMGLILLNWACLIKMLVLVAFTVLYHKCKQQSHGGGSLKYTKVPNNEPMIGSEIP